jgi:hypothetical protein
MAASPGTTRRLNILLPFTMAVSILNKARSDPGSALAALANLATAFGIVFAIVQYSEQVDERRTEQSLQYTTTWEDAKYLGRYEDLQTQISTLLSSRSQAEIDFIKKSEPRAAQMATDNIARKAIGALGPNGSQDVEQLFYFFNKISICVNYSLCSEKATDVFFYDTASTFWAYFQWYAIEKRSAGYPDYARELEKYLAHDPNEAWYLRYLRDWGLRR